MDFLKGLNPKQREAVCHFEGPLLILAGAGSGKTRVITYRIGHLIHARGVPGHSILAVTFTNKAADEMRERLRGLLAGSGTFGTPTVCSFCVRLLRQDGRSLADLRPGFTPGFVIYDEDDQLAVVKAAYRQVGLDDKFMPYRTALSRISHAKNRREGPEELVKNRRDPNAERLAAVYERYEGALRHANALDFDDLLLEAVRLLKHDDRVRQAYNRHYRFLLIDEYQDTNRSQYELVRLLTQAQRNVCAVGDEDQSIYGWRGADIRNILDFNKDYPEAVVIRLEQNYRSTRTILEGASSVVAHNRQRMGKWLWTESGEGEPIGLYEAPDAENEALFVADTIERLLASDPRDRVAVLYRTNFQSRQLEEALRRYSQDYTVVGGLSFYQRAEIKDALAYLKLLVNPEDTVSLLRVINRPARGIGRATTEQVESVARQRGCSLWEAIGILLHEGPLPVRAHAALSSFRNLIQSLVEAAREENVGALLHRIVEETGYRKMLAADGSPEAESQLENLEELINAAAEAAARGEGPREFLDHAALVSEADQLDSQARVSLLTAHNAKGLEWPVVFIVGLEEGLFPHARSVESAAQLEEERRLFYVGMTRAQKRLFLTWAASRRRYGGGPVDLREPSRFLREVPAHCTVNLNEEFAGGINLFAERRQARQAVRKHAYPGRTYNSLENIAQFFSERGLKPPERERPIAGSPAPTRKPAPAKEDRGLRAGVTVEHPRYGRGMILRREGEGEEAKLTVSFTGHGLKKLIAKYAGLRVAE